MYLWEYYLIRMQDLRITYIQSTLCWEDPERNLELFQSRLTETPATDLIILPEMFSTGFSMKPEIFAQDMQGTTVSWMRSMAKAKQCVITGSIMIAEQGHYVNRLVWMKPDGTWEAYDKRHLFRYGGEQNHYTPGKERKCMHWKGWKICPLICYDLRFPVWARNTWTAKGDTLEAAYDLLIYTANWPERRSFAWKSLLPARAIENQAYVAGINRVGKDGHEMDHTGDSAILNFRGEVMSRPNSNQEMQETITLSASALQEFRTSFPAGMDADQFTIKA
jgi:omega-amidase